MNAYTRDIAGWAAEYPTADGVICYGYGETELAMWLAVKQQFAGVPNNMRLRTFARIKPTLLTADEASEVCEMLATPW